LSIAAIYSYFADLTPRLAGVKAAIALHVIFLTRFFRLPMEFFDTTPVGRILSRITKDLDSVDTRLPLFVYAALYYAYEVNVGRFIGIITTTL
jgi:ATP-binding cassette, subfamily C (CFTR/MRP), member 1